MTMDRPLAVFLAHDLLVKLTNTSLLQVFHKANFWHRPFRDGPPLCPDSDVGLDVLLRDHAHALLLQHDQGQRALPPFLVCYADDRHLIPTCAFRYYCDRLT